MIQNNLLTPAAILNSVNTSVETIKNSKGLSKFHLGLIAAVAIASICIISFCIKFVKKIIKEVKAKSNESFIQDLADANNLNVSDMVIISQDKYKKISDFIKSKKLNIDLKAICEKSPSGDMVFYNMKGFSTYAKIDAMMDESPENTFKDEKYHNILFVDSFCLDVFDSVRESEKSKAVLNLTDPKYFIISKDDFMDVIKQHYKDSFSDGITVYVSSLKTYNSYKNDLSNARKIYADAQNKAIRKLREEGSMSEEAIKDVVENSKKIVKEFQECILLLEKNLDGYTIFIHRLAERNNPVNLFLAKNNMQLNDSGAKKLK